MLMNWLEDIVAIHRGLHRDGDIIETIPAAWHHKDNLNLFMFKLLFFMTNETFKTGNWFYCMLYLHIDLRFLSGCMVYSRTAGSMDR